MEGAIQQAPQSGRQFISSDSLQAISVQKIWQGYNSYTVFCQGVTLFTRRSAANGALIRFTFVDTARFIGEAIANVFCFADKLAHLLQHSSLHLHELSSLRIGGDQVARGFLRSGSGICRGV
jgi:hypothetical protein